MIMMKRFASVCVIVAVTDLVVAYDKAALPVGISDFESKWSRA